MNFTHSQISNQIHLITFESQLEITSTLLRIQEHYESPEFRGKIFALDEYQAWYTKLKGDFTYYTDWNGFNFPSYVLKPFWDGKFDPLSEKEQAIVDLFRGKTEPFYVIGVHKGMSEEKVDSLLTHETAHGLYYTNPDYKSQIDQILSEYDLASIKSELASLGGYHEAVLQDECHAYGIDSSSKLKTPIPEEMRSRLRTVYQEYQKELQI
mgnify:CR=1 FL=1